MFKDSNGNEIKIGDEVIASDEKRRIEIGLPVGEYPSTARQTIYYPIFGTGLPDEPGNSGRLRSGLFQRARRVSSGPAPCRCFAPGIPSSR